MTLAKETEGFKTVTMTKMNGTKIQIMQKPKTRRFASVYEGPHLSKAEFFSDLKSAEAHYNNNLNKLINDNANNNGSKQPNPTTSH
jgi:hypothetical protein